MMIYISLTLGFVSTFLGVLAAAGYVFDMPWLRGLRGDTPMAPNTAIAFICLGLAHVALVLYAPAWLKVLWSQPPSDHKVSNDNNYSC